MDMRDVGLKSQRMKQSRGGQNLAHELDPACHLIVSSPKAGDHQLMGSSGSQMWMAGSSSSSHYMVPDRLAGRLPLCRVGRQDCFHLALMGEHQLGTWVDAPIPT